MTYTHRKIVNIYIFYEISSNNNNINNNNNCNNYSTLKNCLLGADILTENSDIDKYKYFGCGIGFDGHGSCSHPSGRNGRNVILFGVDMSSSTKIDNRKKDILILSFGPTQGLEHILSAEKMHSINFTESNEKFCLSFHYNGANSYLFVNGTKIHKFKAKEFETVATPFCLGSISKDWTI